MRKIADDQFIGPVRWTRSACDSLFYAERPIIQVIIGGHDLEVGFIFVGIYRRLATGEVVEHSFYDAEHRENVALVSLYPKQEDAEV